MKSIGVARVLSKGSLGHKGAAQVPGKGSLGHKLSRPRVLVVTRRTARKSRNIEYVGEAHLENLMQAGLLPVIVPIAEGALSCLPEYSRDMRGLLLVEGEDVEPVHYRANKGNFRYLEKTDPRKDQIEMRLLRQAVREKLPIIGICRGSQLLNVVCGGTLYGDVQKEKKFSLKHINYEHYDTYRHPITILKGTPLHKWYGRTKLNVNSYHHQGVRDLARRFQPMAFGPDELVEGYWDPKARFMVGLQFHPERMAEEPEGAKHIWDAFAAAIAGRPLSKAVSAKEELKREVKSATQRQDGQREAPTPELRH